MHMTFGDPEYAEAFRAYVNYFEDLAGTIGGLYGVEDSLAAGVHTAVAEHPPIRRVQRRSLDTYRFEAVETASVANNALMNDAIEIKSALIPTRRGPLRSRR